MVLTSRTACPAYAIGADGSGVAASRSSGIDTSPSSRRRPHLLHLGSRRQSVDLPHFEPGAAAAQGFEGSYNVTPRLSFDGKLLAFITRNAGRFQVTVEDLASPADHHPHRFGRTNRPASPPTAA